MLLFLRIEKTNYFIKSSSKIPWNFLPHFLLSISVFFARIKVLGIIFQRKSNLKNYLPDKQKKFSAGQLAWCLNDTIPGFAVRKKFDTSEAFGGDKRIRRAVERKLNSDYPKNDPPVILKWTSI